MIGSIIQTMTLPTHSRFHSVLHLQSLPISSAFRWQHVNRRGYLHSSIFISVAVRVDSTAPDDTALKATGTGCTPRTACALCHWYQHVGRYVALINMLNRALGFPRSWTATGDATFSTAKIIGAFSERGVAEQRIAYTNSSYLTNGSNPPLHSEC